MGQVGACLMHDPGETLCVFARAFKRDMARIRTKMLGGNASARGTEWSLFGCAESEK